MKNQAEEKVFFHTGLPKAASTFLQRRFFPYLEGIEFIKKHHFKHFPHIARENHGPLLFSTELDLDLRQSKEKIQRFKACFPQATPLLVLRRQDSLLASRYKYHIRKNGGLYFEEFFDLEANQGRITKEELYFFSKIQYLKEAFGDQPIILFQEELKQHPFQTMDMLAERMGTNYNKEAISLKPVNTSYTARQLRAMRSFNRQIPGCNHEHFPYLLKRLSKKSRQGLIHSIAGISYFIPEGGTVKNTPLIDPVRLQEIRKFYEADWQQCVDYVKKTRPLFMEEGNTEKAGY